jgi:hypothetical protein
MLHRRRWRSGAGNRDVRREPARSPTDILRSRGDTITGSRGPRSSGMGNSPSAWPAAGRRRALSTNVLALVGAGTSVDGPRRSRRAHLAVSCSSANAGAAAVPQASGETDLGCLVGRGRIVSRQRPTAWFAPRLIPIAWPAALNVGQFARSPRSRSTPRATHGVVLLALGARHLTERRRASPWRRLRKLEKASAAADDRRDAPADPGTRGTPDFAERLLVQHRGRDR